MSAQLDTVGRALAVLGDDPEATDLRLLLLGNRAASLGNLGRPAEAVRAIGEALGLAERAGAPTRLARLRVQAAGRLFFVGRWDDALAELDAAADLPLQVADRLLQRGLAALIAVHRDDRAAADSQLRDVDDLRLPAGELRQLAMGLLVARALAAERDQQPGHALTRLLAVLDADSTRQFAALAEGSYVWLPDLVRLALAAREQSVALAATRVCEAAPVRQPASIPAAAARHCRGLLDADPAPVLAAADAYRDIGYPLYQAQALENAAVLLAKRGGDPAAARAAYAEATRTYADLDAGWDLRRADTRLRPYGIRRGIRGPRRRPGHGWEALSPTELRVARLVADGRSNPDIAAELLLSRRTVQSHVAHILAKLDAHSRVEIAQQATRHAEVT